MLLLLLSLCWCKNTLSLQSFHPIQHHQRFCNDPFLLFVLCNAFPKQHAEFYLSVLFKDSWHHHYTIVKTKSIPHYLTFKYSFASPTTPYFTVIYSLFNLLNDQKRFYYQNLRTCLLHLLARFCFWIDFFSYSL